MNQSDYKRFFTYSSLLLASSLFVLSACTVQPKIELSTEERVVISSNPLDFLWSLELAKRECDTTDRIARYVSGKHDAINKLEFECIDPNLLLAEEVEADTAADSEAVSE